MQRVNALRTKKAKAQDTTPKLCDAEFMATRYSVEAKTIRKWASEGKIPVVRLSARCLRFDVKACDAALEKRTLNAK